MAGISNGFDVNDALTTRIYPEQVGGVFICGVNWGGDPNGQQQTYAKSYFSDSNSYDYPFRNKIRDWFGMWGAPLAQSNPTPWERCVAQGNWLPTQSRSFKESIVSECALNRSHFISILEFLKPSLVIFASCSLLRALNTHECIGDAERCLGKKGEPQFLKLSPDGFKGRRFMFGLQDFAATRIVAIPHPASRGLQNDYLAAFDEKIAPILTSVRGKVLLTR